LANRQGQVTNQPTFAVVMAFACIPLFLRQGSRDGLFNTDSFIAVESRSHRQYDSLILDSRIMNFLIAARYPHPPVIIGIT
jgi:hypothetical protein